MFPFVVTIIWFNANYKPIKFLLDSLCCNIFFLPKHKPCVEHCNLYGMEWVLCPTLVAITFGSCPIKYAISIYSTVLIPVRSYCTGKKKNWSDNKWPRALTFLSLLSKIRSATYFGEKRVLLCNKTIRVESRLVGLTRLSRKHTDWV